MKITLRYFASLREQLGLAEEVLVLDGTATAAEVWRQLGEKYEHLPDQILCAVNHRYVGMDAVLADGDELAFFPAVTGG